MRTYGRTTDAFGNKTWQVVETDTSGFNDAVYLTTVAQVLQGSPGESPFYANYGIPALASAQEGIPPDYYMALTQTLFSPFFANLQITKTQSVDAGGRPLPAYSVVATTHQGAIIGTTIPT